MPFALLIRRMYLIGENGKSPHIFVSLPQIENMRLIEFQQVKEIPEYLRQKSGLASQVIFVALFAIVFINVYQPFNSYNWADVHGIGYFLWSCAIVAVGFFALVISRIILYFYAKKHRMFYWVFALWIFIEISAIAVIYTTIAAIFMPNTANFSVADNNMSDFYWNAFFYVFFVMAIPTVLCWLYLAFVQKKNELKILQKQVDENTVPGIQVSSPSVLQFNDEKGETRFSVKAENVIWIESADNYVIIKYQNQGKISDFLLRNSLKRLSEDFKDTTLFRCHRSFMVNFDHAIALRRGAEGLIIELDTQPTKVIPVSKTYKDETSQAFTRYNCLR